MIIAVLVCRADGTQVLEQREVADDFFPVPEEQEGGENPAPETETGAESGDAPTAE